MFSLSLSLRCTSSLRTCVTRLCTIKERERERKSFEYYLEVREGERLTFSREITPTRLCGLHSEFQVLSGESGVISFHIYSYDNVRESMHVNM